MSNFEEFEDYGREEYSDEFQYNEESSLDEQFGEIREFKDEDFDPENIISVPIDSDFENDVPAESTLEQKLVTFNEETKSVDPTINVTFSPVKKVRNFETTKSGKVLTWQDDGRNTYTLCSYYLNDIDETVWKDWGTEVVNNTCRTIDLGYDRSMVADIDKLSDISTEQRNILVKQERDKINNKKIEGIKKVLEEKGFHIINLVPGTAYINPSFGWNMFEVWEK